MNKKLLTIGTTILILAIATTTAVLLLFPYEPKHPPTVNSTASTPQGIQEVVDANNKFAFDLYSELAKSETGNLFYSPYSISAALAMTYEGAKGETADEMIFVLHFPHALEANFAAIYNDLNQPNDAYTLGTGNALWIQNDYPLLADYTSEVAKYYGGKAVNLDFIRDTENSRQTINSFIEEQTNNKIKDLIPKGFINQLTRLVLTNAIYFKGTWVWEFDKSNTHEQDFMVTPTTLVKTPMMYMDPSKAVFNYAGLEGLQILELPYRGDKISMLILLPTENLDSIGPLTAEKLNEYKSQMKETKMDSISIPKFEFDTKYSLKDALSALGMPAAFSTSADFSGMTGKKDLFISFVIHQAFVKVDEEGTEAAAATAVGMGLTAVMQRNVFMADRPFIFIIQEKETGNILFIGRVTDPSK
ncbi:MAG: serpin family protein [Candidatus Woesearchaeota archaeon]